MQPNRRLRAFCAHISTLMHPVSILWFSFFLTFGEEFYLFFYFVFTFIFILGSFWVFVLLVLPTASQAAHAWEDFQSPAAPGRS